MTMTLFYYLKYMCVYICIFLTFLGEGCVLVCVHIFKFSKLFCCGCCGCCGWLLLLLLWLWLFLSCLFVIFVFVLCLQKININMNIIQRNKYFFSIWKILVSCAICVV